ncbi:sulfite exporter TauE/SafE family protein [Motiliproteus sp.]|uniref:sulfite exporter TauE/SafE family protein n=1 Tax=Motiliproteus sp. TaxID=1898955 RepID=UPI003BA96481
MDLELLILTVAALLTGISKFSVGGMGMLVLPILMIVYPGPEVLGVLIPLYLWNDLAVMFCYRQRINWRIIAALAPLLVLGMALGSWLLQGLDADRFRLLTGTMILAMLGLSLWLDDHQSQWLRHPLASRGAGLLGGLISMTTNTAGPLLSLYLMEQPLDKRAYMSTRAWIFILVNVFKVPLLIGLGLMTWESTQTSLWGIPGLALGGLIGFWLVRRLQFAQFKWLIRGTAALAAIKLFVFS